MAGGRWCFPCDSWIENGQVNAGRNKGPKDAFWKSHLATESHLKAEANYSGPVEGEWDGFTIAATIASGKPLEFRGMALAMRKHGYTKKIIPLPDAYLVIYEKKEDAQKCLKSNNKFHGTCIKARPKFKSTAKAAAVDIMKLQLSGKGSWEDQALELAVALKLAGVDAKEQEAVDQQIQKLCSDISSTLSGFFPKVECFVYGSRITGLAGKDSDVDLYVKLDKSGTEFENMDSSHLSSQEVIKKCDRLLRRMPHLFSNILTIYAARIPVTHILHLPSMIECDITCKNMLAVNNSRFLKFLVSLDKRIYLFFLVIKQWKKARNLSMSTYSLTLLVIFYLQNLPQPFLPSIQELKDKVVPAVEENGWICSFQDTPFEISNKISLQDLLVGFFKFVPTLDFAVDVICPLLGTTVPKWQFLDPDNLNQNLRPSLNENDPAHQLSFNKPACLQDPFELNHNCLKGLSNNQLLQFINMSIKVAEHCEETSISLLEMIKFNPVETKPKPNAISFSEKIFLRGYMPCLDLLKEHSIRHLWFKEVLQLIYTIFTEVLTFSVPANSGSGSEGPPNKMLKATDPTAAAVWSFSTPTIVIDGRKKYQPGLSLGSRLIREFLASKLMAKKFYQNAETLEEKFHLKVKVEVTFHEKPTFVNLSVTNCGSNKAPFLSLARFITQDVQNIVDNTLMLPYKTELENVKKLESLQEQLESFQWDNRIELVNLMGGELVSKNNEKPEASELKNCETQKGGMESNPFLNAIEKLNDK